MGPNDDEGSGDSFLDLELFGDPPDFLFRGTS
jgi:hypothetical protein